MERMVYMRQKERMKKNNKKNNNILFSLVVEGRGCAQMKTKYRPFKGAKSAE